MMEQRDWREQANCLGRSDAYFSTAKSTTIRRGCRGCPVRSECLRLAISSPWEPHGVWGGLPTERVRQLWVQHHPNYRTATAEAGLPA